MNKYGAEFIGTFWLVLGGCGSALLAAAFPNVGIGLLGVALAFGLTVLTMAFAIGHISGCHLNPAVSFGLWAGGRFPAKELLPYIVAQVLGGIAAAGVRFVLDRTRIGGSELRPDAGKLRRRIGLQAEVIHADSPVAPGDREVEARILDHPFRVVGLANRGFGAEQRRVEADAGVEVGDTDVHVEAFHGLTFRVEMRVADDGAQADGPHAPPSAAQQFSVMNASRRFIVAIASEWARKYASVSSSSDIRPT